MKAKQVMIDALSGFELALAAAFRKSLYRLVAVLNGMRVTVLMAAELEDRYPGLRFSLSGNAFLADAIMMHRYGEIQGELKRVLSVVNVRDSTHRKQIRCFDIDSDKITVRDPLLTYQGILSDKPIEIR